MEECEKSPSTAVYFPDPESLVTAGIDNWHDRPATTWSIKKIGTLQARLEILRREKERNGNFGAKDSISNISCSEVVNLANEVFGYNGWSLEILSSEVVSLSHSDDESYNMKMKCEVRITLKDGTFHEHVGKGQAYNIPRYNCFNKCKKEAVTDATKKAIYALGSVVAEHEIKLRNNYYI